MKKIFVAALVVISVFAASVVSSFAIDKVSTVYEIIKWGLTPHEVNSGEDEWVAMRDQTYALWQPYSSVSSMAHAVLSFDALSNLVSDLNGSGFPCYLEFNRNLQLYVIRGTGPVTGLTGVSVLDRYLTNGQRGLLCCEYNTDSLLSSISSTLTTKLTTLTNGVASIYTKLSSIDDTVLIGTGTLNNIYNYLTGDLTTYLQSIDSSVGGSETFLGQISTKMDSVVNTLTTENGKNSLFYPITQRLDTIISRIVPAYSHPFAHRGWCLSGNDLSSLSVSDVGYNALSSMMETVTEEYLSYDFFAGAYHIDVLDSLGIVHATVGGNTGYFIRGTGTLSKSVNGINEFYEDQTFYLGESNNTLFYASDDSRGSAGTVNLSTVEFYLSRTVGHLSGLSDKLTYLFGEYDELYQFPVLGSTSGTVRGVSSSSFSVSAYDSRLFVSRDSRVSGASSGISYGGDFSGYPYTLYNVGSGFVYREVIPATYDFMDALISAGFSSDSFNSVRTIAISEYEFEDVPVEATLDGDSFIIQVGIVLEWEDSFNIDSNALSGFRIGRADYRNGEIQFLSSPSFYDVGISYSFSRLSPAMNVEAGSGSYYYSVCSNPFTHHDCDCGRYLVTYSSRFTGFVQNQFDRVIEKLGNLPASSGSTADLSNVENALSTIIDKMDNLPASVENTVVNITEDNDAFNIFYVTDEDGNEKSVTSVAGESLSASGKLLEFLYKLVVRGALDNVDDSITGLNDFFFDDAPSGLGEGVSIWD